MCDIRYFRRAKHNYDNAVLVLKHYKTDELYLLDAAYKLQQSVEFTLKAFLECKGVTVPETQQVNKLLRMTKDNGSACIITPWIAKNAIQLSEWESNTRYNFDYYLELSSVQEGIVEIGHFLEINGLTFEKDPALTKEAEMKLLQKLPKDIVISDVFELNVYYHVFKKSLSIVNNMDSFN